METTKGLIPIYAVTILPYAANLDRPYAASVGSQALLRYHNCGKEQVV